MNPKISVIVPVYNVEKYLPQCVESILSQTFTDFELLLVDDGSPDGSGGICDEYARRDQRVRVFHKENGGQSSARNLALDNCKGEYIFFVDSDDYISPETIEVNLKKAELMNCDIVQFPVARIEEGREFLEKEQDSDVLLDSTELFLYSWIVNGKLTNYVCGKCIKSDVWNDLRFPEDQIFEDRFLMPDILYSCSRIMISNQGLYHYVQHSGQTVKRKSDYYFVSSALQANIHALQRFEFTTRIMDTTYVIHLWNTLPIFEELLLLNKEKAITEFGDQMKEVILKLPSILKILISKAPLSIRIRLVKSLLCKAIVLEK